VSKNEVIDVTGAFERGVTRFMGLELEVRAGALVPRPETELLGGEAVELLRQQGGALRVIDVCCGSGNLACAIAAKVLKTEVWALDLTEGCTTLAERNAQKLGLPVKVRRGDLFAPIADERLEGTVDLIVCNPPYISTGKLEKERQDLLRDEPREAFDGGPYGLSIHSRVIKEALPLLKTGAPLLFEFGLGQEKQMKMLFDRSKSYRDLRFINDASGAPRVAVAHKL
jgi:release factor glutamine methyltransferase